MSSKQWYCDEAEDDYIEIASKWDKDFNLRMCMMEEDEGSLSVYLNVEKIMSIRDHLNKVLEGL